MFGAARKSAAHQPAVCQETQESLVDIKDEMRALCSGGILSY